MLIGLTGKYCAGKNHVAALLEARGFEVLDVDKLGHKATEDQKEAIVGLFGPGVLRQDGAVDRRVLGELTFPTRTNLPPLKPSSIRREPPLRSVDSRTAGKEPGPERRPAPPGRRVSGWTAS
jgi:hypothetical protein